jgi:hypothetical protein
MKILNLLILTIGISLTATAQTEDKVCNQIAIAKPDKKATCSDDIEKILSEKLPSSFTQKSEHDGNFKLIVDCNGVVDMVIFKQGNLTSAEQKYFLTQINKLKTWTSAEFEGKTVTTYVYIRVEIKNRQLTYKLY